METDVVVVLCTAPPGDAERIADLVVGKRKAACVNIMGVGSVYRWEGKIQREREELMIIKTDRKHLDALMETISGAHPYEVPEIVALPVIAGTTDYLEWVRESVGGRPSP
ncbi:divalent-cation tolerance protein CutA [Methanofollis tationis]|uniref:Divalent-cation tolerance protein CutA n=1 Tax=Methanofollis tationis TaxID=81417 RepID=A0A7K4HKY8_9EURY|nr:divalent-cation tolerance protein CutA [Methanofollis tationis]NVO65842.1 divalent-cation tolerance protein CutA [Methanofollis tationis]